MRRTFIKRPTQRRRGRTRFFFFLAVQSMVGMIVGGASAEPVRIMPVGDSITVGTMDVKWSFPFTFGYRGPLCTMLTNAGYDIQFVGASGEPWNEPFGSDIGVPTDIQGLDLRTISQDNHRGYGGATTSQILNGGVISGSTNAPLGIVEMLNADDPDVVLLMIGTNGPADGMDHIDSLVGKIVATKPDVRLIVATIPPRSTYQQGTVDYNNYIKNTVVPKYAALGKNVTVVDQYVNLLTNPADLKSVDASLFTDSAHMKPVANERMAQTWYQGIRAVVPGPEAGHGGARSVRSAVTSLTPPLPSFNGLDTHLGNLYRLSNAESRAISAENFTGAKGKGGMATEGYGKHTARELGQGWKISPAVFIEAKSTFTVAEIDGSGAIQHIWMTPYPFDKTRLYILRVYWDGETEPSIEVPLGDFFACGWGEESSRVNSLPVCVNPSTALNCYWNMPFRKKAKITIENLNSEKMILFYQVDYTLTDVPDDAAYFHAQFRRVKKLPLKTVYTLLDGVQGRGHYVGTYMAWETRSPGWWGEGETKFYLDGDEEFPTICGTGTEDYFCGAFCFRNPHPKPGEVYETFNTPYAGMPQVLPPDAFGQPGQRFGLYRWHIPDPIRFKKDLRVTIQALGVKSEGRYRLLEDDIASVAYWYQAEPHAKFPPLPAPTDLVIQPLVVAGPETAK